MKSFWVFQELNQFGNFFLGFVNAGDIGESGVLHFLVADAVLAATKVAKHSAGATARVAHAARKQKPQDSKNDQRGQNGHGQLRKGACGYIGAVGHRHGFQIFHVVGDRGWNNGHIHWRGFIAKSLGKTLGIWLHVSANSVALNHHRIAHKFAFFGKQHELLPSFYGNSARRTTVNDNPNENGKQSKREPSHALATWLAWQTGRIWSGRINPLHGFVRFLFRGECHRGCINVVVAHFKFLLSNHANVFTKITNLLEGSPQCRRRAVESLQIAPNPTVPPANDLSQQRHWLQNLCGL